MARPQSTETPTETQAETQAETPTEISTEGIPALTFVNAGEYAAASLEHGVSAHATEDAVVGFYDNGVSPNYASRRHNMTRAALKVAFVAMRRVEALEKIIQSMAPAALATPASTPTRGLAKPKTKKVKKTSSRKIKK